MDNQTKGFIYILCGMLIVLITASELILRLLLAAIGFYFIYIGLLLRSSGSIFINISQFFSRFHDNDQF